MADNIDVPHPTQKGRSEDFAAIEDFDNPRIDEAVFIRNFLVLMFDPDLPEDVQVASNLRWIKYAGHPAMPLDVYRDGQKIYTVPALLEGSKDALVAKARETDAFRLLLQDVRAKSDIAQHFGDELLNQYVGQMANKDLSVNPKIAAQWRHILDFYGITAEIVKAHTGNELSASGTVSNLQEKNFGQSTDHDEDC